MEDYIFLIIAVVISILAAINKNRKAKMAEQTFEEEDADQATERRNRFMDQLLGEDFLEEKEEPIAPPMRVKPTPPPAKVFTKSSDDRGRGLNYQLPRFKSTLPERPKRPSIASAPRYKEEEEMMVETEDTESYMEDFSLRKAVVYSLIIEQKF